jgi:hypothetical protein
MKGWQRPLEVTYLAEDFKPSAELVSVTSNESALTGVLLVIIQSSCGIWKSAVVAEDWSLSVCFHAKHFCTPCLRQGV